MCGSDVCVRRVSDVCQTCVRWCQTCVRRVSDVCQTCVRRVSDVCVRRVCQTCVSDVWQTCVRRVSDVCGRRVCQTCGRRVADVWQTCVRRVCQTCVSGVWQTCGRRVAVDHPHQPALRASIVQLGMQLTCYNAPVLKTCVTLWQLTIFSSTLINLHQRVPIPTHQAPTVILTHL